jgi:hypothetical protein
MLVSCVDEMSTESFDNIKLDKTMLVLPVDGGSVTLTVNATEDWAFDTLYTKDAWPNVITRKKNDAGEYYVSKVEASWLSVDKMAGAAGENVLTFSADSVAGGREIELCIKAGLNSQFIKVRQGSMEASSATCAEVIAGPDGKTYRVKGVCTSIANTQYGNWSVVVLDGWETADDRIMVMSSEANENLYGNMFYNRIPLDIRSNIDDHTRNYFWNGYCRFGVGFNTWKHIALAVNSSSAVNGATKLD